MYIYICIYEFMCTYIYIIYVHIHIYIGAYDGGIRAALRGAQIRCCMQVTSSSSS